MDSDDLAAIKSSLNRIARARDELELCNGIAESLIDHFGFTRVTLRNVNADDKTLSLLCDLGFFNRTSATGSPRSDDSVSLTGGSMALSEEEELLTANSLLPEFAGLSSVMISSPYALAPIKVKDKTTIVLGAAKKRDRGIISPQDKEVLGLFSEIAGVTSENILSKEVLIRDELTEVYNRHYFMKRLNEEFERARRYDIPLSCCLFDIDDFKLINDTYGHIFGDKVLRQIAGLTKDIVRGTDIVARYGGEEFIILFTHTGQENAIIAVEQISRTISNLIFCQDEKEARVTATFGLAIFRQTSTRDSGTLLHHADMALYEGKRQYQKNSIVIHAEKGFRILRRDESLVGKIRNIRNTLERLSRGGEASEETVSLQKIDTDPRIASMTLEAPDNPSRSPISGSLHDYWYRGRKVSLFTRSGLVIVLLLVFVMLSFGDKEGGDNSTASNASAPEPNSTQSISDLSCTLIPVNNGSLDEMIYEGLLLAGNVGTEVEEKVEEWRPTTKVSMRARKVNPRLAMGNAEKTRTEAKVQPIEWQLKNAFFLLSEL